MKETEEYKKKEEKEESHGINTIIGAVIIIILFVSGYAIGDLIYMATTWLDFTKAVFFAIVLVTIVKAVNNNE